MSEREPWAALRPRLQVRRVVGEIMADLVETGRTPHPISRFRLTRFAASEKRAAGVTPAVCSRG